MKLAMLDHCFAASLTLVACCISSAEGQEPQRIGHFDRIPSEGKVFAHPACFSHDGKLIAVSSYDEPAIRIIEVKGHRTITKVKSSRTAELLTFSADGSLMATSGAGNDKPRLWNTKDWTLYRELAEIHGPTGGVFLDSANATLGVFSHSDLAFCIYDVKSMKELQRIRSDLTEVTQGVLSPNWKTIAFANKQGDVQLVSIQNGKSFAQWKAHDQRPGRLVFSPDSAMLATCTPRSELGQLWRSNDGKFIRTFQLPPRFQGLNRMEFSIDGQWIGVAANWRFIPVFDTKTGRQAYELTGLEHSPNWIAFSPDGVTVAAPSRDGTIFLWTLPKDK
ncbi:MAG: WD40 repeat domain-containing protein [Gemmataceae bacterium]|nr:WD40 repeat domain-containing protein [Gemmataceae bacterium]